MSDSASRLDFLEAELRRLRAQLRDEGAGAVRDELRPLMDILAELMAELGRQRRQIERLAWNQRNFDARVLPIEYSRFFRALRWAGGRFQVWKAQAGQWLLHSRLHPLYLKIFSPPAKQDYEVWLERERAGLRDAKSYADRAGEFHRRPTISIVLPVHNPRSEWLEAALGSVLAQSYPCWELCICDDSSAGLSIADYLRGQAAIEPRIRFIRSDAHLGIAGALNRAGELATGEYVGFLDQDDMLAPHALHDVVAALQKQDPVLIYSDEDQIDTGGRRRAPIFKPAWDPELLAGCMYLGHFLVAHRAALEQAGWFRSEFDGSQDYDLALRLTDGRSTVCHIPRVLYHWRRHEGSTAGNPAAKPYAHRAGRRALEEAVRRRGYLADVLDGDAPATFRLWRRVQGQPRASLVICSRNAKLLRRCLRAIDRQTDYGPRETIVVEHREGNRAAMDRLLRGAACTVVPYDGPFNFSLMNNRGAQAARGEVLVFLNDDVEPLAPGWLAALIAQVERPEVGAAGARLLYPSGAVQHSGIAIGIMDGAGHPQRACFETPYWNWGGLTRSVSAVTAACLAIRKEVFEELGGFDAAFPVNYNDVDLCLRAWKAGYSVLCESAARLRHFEAQTRLALTRYQERELLHERWAAELQSGDPFYSPNLTAVREDASLRLEDWPPQSSTAVRISPGARGRMH